MARKRRNEFGVGLLLIGALAVSGFMAVRIGAFSGFAPRVAVSVAIEDAAGLEVGAAVAVAGVDIGTVDGMEIEHDVAVVSLSILEEAQIRDDAVVRVRARSILGERYLEVVPQSRSAAPLKSGDTLPRVGQQTEIDEIVNQLGPMLDAVDPELFARLMDGLGRALEDDPERLARMLRNADRMIENAALVSEDLPALSRDVRGSVDAVTRAAWTLDARAKQSEALIGHAEAAMVDLRNAAQPLPALAERTGVILDQAGRVIAPLQGSGEDLATLLARLAAMDADEMERLLLEDGVRVRLFGSRRRVAD
jgi:phospholipid/cholesterol/gamma-HCH transport system substrate-binding protein